MKKGHSARLFTTFTIALAIASGVVASADDEDVKVKGRVIDAKTSKPVASAAVFVRDWRTITDQEGRFQIELPPGVWTIETWANQYQPSSLKVDACRGCAPEVDVVLIPERFLEEHVEVTASANGGSDLIATTPVRPVEVLNVAGAFENVFRVLQTMPGVTATSEIDSRMSVRGGGPDQNLTVMDGVEISNPYRLWGLVSAFNPETVEGFELSTGAFSAKYGDRLSSNLVIENRAGTTSSALKGSVGLSLTDGNAIVEGRLPKNTGSWLITGRRTWYDLVAESFTEGDDELPGFNDVQAKVVLDLRDGRTLTVSGLRSREKSDMTYAEDFNSGTMKTTARNDLVAASLFLPLFARATSRTIAAYSKNDSVMEMDAHFRDEMRRSNAEDDTVGFSYSEIGGSFTGGARDRSLREELSVQLTKRHLIEAGFEFHHLTTETEWAITHNRPDEGLRDFPDSMRASRSDNRSGAWLIDRVQAAAWLNLEAGLRFDASGINDRKEYTPRLSATASLSASTRLRAAFGIHTQSPGYEKLAQSDYVLDFSQKGKLALDNERARHVIVGLERDLAPGVTARLEGFYKRFDRLIVGRLETPEETAARIALYDFPADLASSIPAQAQITSLPVNGGRGTAYGFDLFLARRAVSASTRLTGWIAYTFTSANRDCYGRTFPFEYEQPHALSVVGNFRLSPRFEVSMTGRFASGFPKTPPLGLYVTGTIDTKDVDGDGNLAEIIPERDSLGSYVYAINYGSVDNLNRKRQPAYARLDLRATFVPRWGKGRWRFYVDVLNAFNRNNGPVSDVLEYDPGADRPRIKEKREGGLPFVPSFGIHVRF